MASKQHVADKNQGRVVHRLFLAHPHSLGMTWGGHGAGAIRIGAKLIGAGCAAMVHALVPGLFTETAGRAVTRIYDHIQSRKAGAKDPEAWPDYEI